jgi:hypothetical protein
MHVFYRLTKTGEHKIALGGDELPGLEGPSAVGTLEVREPLKAPLSELIERINQIFGADLGQEAILTIEQVQDRMIANKALQNRQRPTRSRTTVTASTLPSWMPWSSSAKATSSSSTVPSRTSPSAGSLPTPSDLRYIAASAGLAETSASQWEEHPLADAGPDWWRNRSPGRRRSVWWRVAYPAAGKDDEVSDHSAAVGQPDRGGRQEVRDAPRGLQTTAAPSQFTPDCDMPGMSGLTGLLPGPLLMQLALRIRKANFPEAG